MSIFRQTYVNISKKYQYFNKFMSICQKMSIFQQIYVNIKKKHVNISLNLCQIDAGTLHGGAVSGHGGWLVSLVPPARSSGYIYIYIDIY